MQDLVGLALSGGGIRSASFCLGVLQALDSEHCLKRIDYLSTVSGGGYIGCCLTTCMTADHGEAHINERDGRYGDTAAVRHIRDFSNYLIPRGFGDVVTAMGLIGRGLAANAILLSPFFILSILALMGLSAETPTHVDGDGLPDVLWHVFPFTILFLGVTIGLLAVWAFKKTVETRAGSAGDDAELQGRFVTAWKFMLWVIALAAWAELQPLMLAVVTNQSPPAVLQSCLVEQGFGVCLQSLLTKWFTVATPWLAPFAAAVGFLSRALGRLTSARKGLRATSLLKRLAAKALLWGAAIVVPSLIWLLYLKTTAALIPTSDWTVRVLLGLLALSFLAVYVIDPNATSLHRLYRDRLGKAFLFDPTREDGDPDPTPEHERPAVAEVGEQPAPVGRDVPRDRKPLCPRLQKIDTKLCPYPIVNAALNIEGSPFANKRGRNADFFEFTPDYVGSEATGWIGSAKAELAEPKLDLATAMAISGAAVSPNMGSATIKPLVPTLALLNVRLGFWLRNPKHMDKPLPIWTRSSVYFYREIVSNITEDSYKVYLTDGGNIENLGVHALLRRRCRLIIAVDAEADPALTFGAYLKLQRYARIDFGALLDLPWQAVRDQSLAVNKAIAADEPRPSKGPHVAIGRIRYDPKHEGILVYVKSSLTGDEADYILDYKARNPDFPHETTGDQFFGEEQLEVYRALGFHVMRLFLENKVPVVAFEQAGETQAEARKRSIAEVFGLLGLPVPARVP